MYPSESPSRPTQRESLKFKAHCNVCCEMLTDPQGVMTNCRHFICVKCVRERGVRGTCVVCQKSCRTVLLRDIPQEIRELLLADASRSLISAAQAAQWQFSQNLLLLHSGAMRLRTARNQHQLIEKKTEQLTAAIRKLESENEFLRNTHNEDPWGRAQGTGQSGKAADASFFRTPESIFSTGGRGQLNSTGRFFDAPIDARVRPPTSSTTFTNMMANVGL